MALLTVSATQNPVSRSITTSLDTPDGEEWWVVWWEWVADDGLTALDRKELLAGLPDIWDLGP